MTEKKKITMLLIDDEESVYDIVNHYCKKNSKYTIDLHWRDNMPRDLTDLNINNYELLLLDYHIRDVTALDFLKIFYEDMKDEINRLTLPIIILSNIEDVQIAAEMIHYGISEFIPKMNLTQQMLNNKINDVLHKQALKLQLLDLNQQLKQHNMALTKQNNEISKFYQIISHELKTPLTSIREFIAIILDRIAGELTEKQEEYLTICKRNCMQLSQYINDLLEVGRLSTGKYQLNKSAININEIIKDVINTSQILANEKAIRIVLHSAKQTVIIKADEVRIYQAILILMNNAIKFSPAHTTIKVEVSEHKSQNELAIAVVDEGCGVDPAHQPLIFDRLFQAKPAVTNANTGLGLGLYICKAILEQHHGEIAVESTPGKGSRFTLKLPYTNPTE